MAKIVIAGESVVITSSVKLEDFQKVKKYRPKALVLMGGEDDKEQVFGVSVVDGSGKLTKFGIEFGKATHDENKFACLTMNLPEVGDRNIKDVVADEIGPAVVLLCKIEEKIPAVLAEIKAEKDAILSNITVMQ